VDVDANHLRVATCISIILMHFLHHLFREFYYIQMEKYARQAVTEGVKGVDDIHISGDSEIYRVLNLHYNRNNHIEVSSCLHKSRQHALT